MELKRRLIQNDDKHLNKATEEVDEENPLPSEDRGTEPGMPSRKSIHSKSQKKSTKLTLGYSISFVAILMVLGGSGWWMKSQVSHQATGVVTPEVKKLEPNKVVQKQPAISNSVPREQTMDKAEQPTKQKVSAQPPADVNPQTTVTTMPVRAKKPEAKRVYKKIMRHKVGAGETLYRISVKYYHTGRYAAFLGKYNRIHDPSNLISGTYIKIPFPPGK